MRRGFAPSDLVESTDDAAFASDQTGRIVAWNDSARRLLGYTSSQILGKYCYEVLASKDPFGNPFCAEACPPRRMAEAREPIHRFEVDVPNPSSGGSVRVTVSIIVVPASDGSQMALVHLLHPVRRSAYRAPTTTPDERPADVPAGSRRDAEHARCPSLTRRELEVLRLLDRGFGTQEIAELLFITRKTVSNHVDHALHKLDAHNRVTALSVARRLRIL